MASKQASLDKSTDRFERRHVGPSPDQQRQMLQALGFADLDSLTDAVVPADIRLGGALDLPRARSEAGALTELRDLVSTNVVARSLIGCGYHDSVTPPVVLRNMLEDPGWYTPYTPYQPEIAQGRLEMLLNFQTMVADLTGLPVANASLLDEATAAAEGLTLCRAVTRVEGGFFIAEHCHPQTIEVVRTRAEVLGLPVHVGDPETADFAALDVCGVLLQSPDTRGVIRDLSDVIARAQDAGARTVVACDLLALTLLRPPGEMGADVAVGSSQRFGVPLGFGGPHAAFLATRADYQRSIPGRLVGMSRDAAGRPALRLALQTREQHIRRDRATSNICTAQALLANVAAAYAIYHGPEGLRAIANRVHALTAGLGRGLRRLGFDVDAGPWFDTLAVRVSPKAREAILERSRRERINLREDLDGELGISLDETCGSDVVRDVLALFDPQAAADIDVNALLDEPVADAGASARSTPFLTAEVFQRYRSEHEMLRYLQRLKSRDLSLAHAMIPLGSCTMKLNATSQMMPISWPQISALHPYAPAEQAAGYRDLFAQLEAWLGEITGFPAVSLQPNAGAQGEYAGLLVIRAYHRSRGDEARDVCLIPTSAHGTNPASAVMAGMRVVSVACDAEGNVELEDLRRKAEEHADRLGALMITYPSTHGVFETAIREICDVVHRHGGQVYLDGANMNAQVGLCRPGDIGADVCHLNLHKTFCIPHGGGGPGMGPIGVAAHLGPFLPRAPFAEPGDGSSVGPVAAASHGSASILPISWMYLRTMGQGGLKRATQVAILAANYMAHRLAPHYPILFTGAGGRVAHEFILDVRPLRKSADISVDDIAKRLIDYGFHAPTMSWPVAGTLMVEPTESESLEELDRFCDAMIAIRQEIREIEEGNADRATNLMKGAPHTAEDVVGDDWERPYSRERAAFPTSHQRLAKFWPAVGRVDNAFGDRHLVCSCPSVGELAEG